MIMSQTKSISNIIRKNLMEHLNKMDKVDEIASKIFSLNYHNILNSEDEFCIGIYEKNGDLHVSKPIIGTDVEVEIPEVDGIMLALVHTHFDGLELSSWDEEIGEDFAIKNQRPFRIYVIGFNEEDELVMTFEEFDFE